MSQLVVIEKRKSKAAQADRKDKAADYAIFLKKHHWKNVLFSSNAPFVLSNNI